MDLRPATAEDERAVRHLHLAAFGDHGRVVAALVDGLRGAHGESAVELVAADGDEVVGHVLFTRASSMRRAVSSRSRSSARRRSRAPGSAWGSAAR